MDRTLSWVATLLALIALAAAVSSCGGSDETEIREIVPMGGPLDSPPSGAYIALGDSIAAGVGASEPATTGYAALLSEALRSSVGEGTESEFLSLAVPDHTTEALVNEQLGPAVERLKQGNVGLVTVTIGWNDLLVYFADPACLPDPSDPACPLEDGLLDVERRLDRALADLREAGPTTAIVIQTYPNLFAGIAHDFERPADIAVTRLNGVIIGVARRHGVLVADPHPDFEGHGHELTHIADPDPDFHPNDDGHRVIADVFLETLGLGEE